MLYLSISMLALLTGFLLDICFGDPHWLPHPVRWIGALISVLEKAMKGCFQKSKATQRFAGVCLAIIVTLTSTAIPLGILILAHWIHPALHFVIASVFCYQMLAAKSLKTESMKVYTQLEQHNLEGARKAVSMIVGRDTANLTEEQIAKAAVETVAENTSDGVIAPLFFMLIGGVPLGFFYKSVNTMDSMIGYRNEHYQYFGTAAARLDDILNYIPARISAYLMIPAAFFARYDAKEAFRVYRRDKHNHASPNSAHTEAVCAGALHIQLAGDAYYFGKLHKKPTIGNADRPIEAKDICRANHLLYITTCIAIVVGLGLKSLLFLCFI